MENKINTTTGQPWHQPPPTPAPLTRYQPPTIPAHHDTTPAVLIDPHQLAALIAAAHTAQTTHNPPTPAPQHNAMSGRAKDTALVLTTTGAGIGMATAGIGAGAAGIGYGGQLLAASSGGLMTAALAVALIIGMPLLAGIWLRNTLTRNRPDNDPQHQAQTPPPVVQHITQQVYAPGMFGRATGGTINQNWSEQ